MSKKFPMKSRIGMMLIGMGTFTFVFGCIRLIFIIMVFTGVSHPYLGFALSTVLGILLILAGLAIKLSN